MVFHLLMLLILSNTHANKGLSIKMCANVYGNKCLLSNIIVHLKSEISLLLHERGYLNFTNETKRVQMCLDIYYITIHSPFLGGPFLELGLELVTARLGTGPMLF